MLTNNLNNIIHFWLDHLEVYASFYDESLFKWIDFDNSNQIFLDEFSGIKSDIRKYSYWIHFSKGNINLFSYFKWSKEWNIATKNYVAIYSSCFRTLWKEWVLEILQKYFTLEKRSSIKRFDICSDFTLPIDVILSKFWPLKQKWSLFIWKKGNIETKYIGEKKMSQNKRQIIRIYNKIEDILGKWKNRLYQDYLIYDNITRIEIEFRRELSKNYTIEELFVDENLLGIMKNYFKKHTNIFETIGVEAISLYKKPKEVSFEVYQSLSYKIDRTKIFIGHAKWLLERWIDPIFILLWKDIIHPKTREVLKDSKNPIKDLRNLKKSWDWWQEILNNLK